MEKQSRLTAFITAFVMCITLLLTSCGHAGGVPASKWKGKWYREFDQPFSRCFAEIKNVTKEGFDFNVTVYNGTLAGQLKNAHASFGERVESNEYNITFEKETGRSDSAFYYAEDPRAYIEFFFADEECTQLNIIFTTEPGSDFVEWTAFPNDFQNDAQITGQYSRVESYLNDNLYDMGILEKKYDSALQKLMGSAVYFRLACCFQNYTSQRSDTTGSNLPYEYNGSVHMHDGIGGTIYYGSMVGQQYAACVIAYDDGSVSAAVSLENGSVSYYSDNWVYAKEQPYPILIWIENYTKEQNGELPVGQNA